MKQKVVWMSWINWFVHTVVNLHHRDGLSCSFWTCWTLLHTMHWFCGLMLIQTDSKWLTSRQQTSQGPYQMANAKKWNVSLAAQKLSTIVCCGQCSTILCTPANHWFWCWGPKWSVGQVHLSSATRPLCCPVTGRNPWQTGCTSSGSRKHSIILSHQKTPQL